MARRRLPISIEWHHLGPRVYLFGTRIHEFALGFAIVGTVIGLAAAGTISFLGPYELLAVFGLWLIAKDWPDLFSSTRNTRAWRVGVHRRASALRDRRGDWVPGLAGLAAGLVAVVNLVSALTPNQEWRARLLRALVPVGTMPLFHALVVPLSVALLATAFYLARRRRRAWQAAVALLVLLGVFNLLKGLDVEEAALSWAAAGLLVWGRDAFVVRHEPLGMRAAFWRVPLVALAGASVIAAVVAIGSPTGTTVVAVFHETVDLLVWSRGPISFHDELRWIPYAAGAIGTGTLLAAAYLLFRPLAAPRLLPDPELRRTAEALVRGHGTDTLAFFKLRGDLHYLFSDDRRAFVAYRVESGVLLLAGDPVGAADAIPAVVRAVVRHAERHGLLLGAVGVAEHLLSLYRQAGLRSLYMGDEAIVETAKFSLEGRAIRKVRQSVSRLEKAGYSIELRGLDDLEHDELDELEHVAEVWREGAPERGFSMAMDALNGEHEDSLVVVARDETGAARGFLHFVPSYGRPAMSLSFMRRDKSAPNGLTEFLVVRAIELLRERGVEEMSLNFAAFARYLHSPRNRRERLLARILRVANEWFQIESLYRFNAKFSPRWEPRYMLYEGSVLGLPRTGLAAMWVEGQLPKPRRRSDRAAAATRR
jgi:lysyl-tRNA synthetase class 2